MFDYIDSNFFSPEDNDFEKKGTFEDILSNAFGMMMNSGSTGAETGKLNESFEDVEDFFKRDQEKVENTKMKEEVSYLTPLPEIIDKSNGNGTISHTTMEKESCKKSSMCLKSKIKRYDYFQKAIKVAAFKEIKSKLAKKIFKEVGVVVKLKTLPQGFMVDTNIETNKEYLTWSLEKAFCYDFNNDYNSIHKKKFVCSTSLFHNRKELAKEKSISRVRYLKKTVMEAMKEYFESSAFKRDVARRKKDSDLFKFVAIGNEIEPGLIEYFLKNYGNKKRRDERDIIF